MPAKATRPIVLNGIGSRGLNTQSQSSTLGIEWLTQAENVVYDLEGRMGPRKGIKQISKPVASPVKSIAEFVKADRTTEYYAGSGSTIVKIDFSTSPDSLITQTFSGTPQTITDSNWQWVNFNDEFWGVQSGHKVINFDGTNWYDIDDLSGYHKPAHITTFDPNCALGDFGRMFYGGVTEAKGTLFYSDNLIGQDVNTGAAGFLDLKTVWGNDEIVGLGSLENKIVIFGKQNIAIYKGATDPSTMILDELIRDVGLAGRDNFVYVGADIVFMSYEGIQSLQRVEQTDGRAPLEGLSTTVRNDLTRLISQADLSTVKSVYYQKEGLMITFMPEQDKAYTFDFSLGKKEFPKITTWTFHDNPLCAVVTLTGKMYLGISNAVAEYDGYYDTVLEDTTATYGTSGACSASGGIWDGSACWATVNYSYNWLFQSPWLNFGDPVFAKILKSGLFTITGGKGSAATIEISKDYEEDSRFSKTFTLTSDSIFYIYGASNALYGSAKYAPSSGPKEYKVPLARTGKSIRIKMTFDVSGKYSSLINLTLFTKQGKAR